jgi:hypothetical protein
MRNWTLQLSYPWTSTLTMQPTTLSSVSCRDPHTETLAGMLPSKPVIYTLDDNAKICHTGLRFVGINLQIVSINKKCISTPYAQYHSFSVSEYGYGVAILNDSKYGYATEGNVMRLSLLRAPTMPDADADQGTHQFAFAIYPHTGTFAESDVAEIAEGFNAPLSGKLF